MCCFSLSVIHRTQHWFHGRIPREESHRIIKQQGLVDGYAVFVQRHLFTTVLLLEIADITIVPLS